MSTIRFILIVVLVSAFNITIAHAAVVTYYFSGEFTSSHALFNNGDAYSGSYSFESTASTVPHPDPTMQIQSVAIDPTLPGTGWNMTVNSSTVGSFHMDGTGGNVALGNDTAYGDRYIVTLYAAAPNTLPNGYSLNLFQLEFFQGGPGKTLLGSGDLGVLPNIFAPGTSVGGRFIVNDGIQSFHVTSTFGTVSPVPLPAAAWLFGSALAGLGFLSRGTLRSKPGNTVRCNS